MQKRGLRAHITAANKDDDDIDDDNNDDVDVDNGNKEDQDEHYQSSREVNPDDIYF